MAENARAIIGTFATIDDLTAEGRQVACQTDLPQVAALPNPTRKRAWVDGHSLVTGAPVLAPYELVGLDFRINTPWDRKSFRMSSTGLAAGRDPERTLIHALLECVEDEAIGQAGLLGGLWAVSTPEGSSAALDEAIQLCEEASLVVEFAVAPNRFDIPVIRCIIGDVDRGGVILTDGGTAATSEMPGSCLAALLEAVQNRAMYISGARDDLTVARYSVRRGRGRIITQDESKSSSSEIVDAEPLQSAAEIVARLLDRGCRDVWLFDLPTGVEGIYVFRVLVAGIGGDPELRGDVTAADFTALARRRGTA